MGTSTWPPAGTTNWPLTPGIPQARGPNIFVPAAGSQLPIVRPSSTRPLLWRSGALALWRSGALALWRSGAGASGQEIRCWSRVPSGRRDRGVETCRARVRVLRRDTGPGARPARTRGSHRPPVGRCISFHVLGFPRDAATWRRWCDDRGLLLIEDADQAWLATVDGQPVGSLGDLSIFCPYKTLPLPYLSAAVSRPAMWLCQPDLAPSQWGQIRLTGPAMHHSDGPRGGDVRGLVGLRHAWASEKAAAIQRLTDGRPTRLRPSPDGPVRSIRTSRWVTRRWGRAGGPRSFSRDWMATILRGHGGRTIASSSNSSRRWSRRRSTSCRTERHRWLCR